MRNTLFLSVCLVLVILILFAVGEYAKRERFSISNATEVFSSVDDMPYRVHLQHAEPQKAADTLAEINRRVIELMRHLRRKYVGTAHSPTPIAHQYPMRTKAVQQLLRNYNQDNIVENSPLDPEGDTSYTIDKGGVLAICLREKTPTASGDPRYRDIHDIDTLMFVVVHELSHIAIKDVDHPPIFWRTFKFMLGEAVGIGLLRSLPYDSQPVKYCGIKVDFNPLDHPELQAIV